LEVESDIIPRRDLLHGLAAKNPRTIAALMECMDDVPWRRERCGEEILKVLKKNVYK